ncbi:phosphatase PAP2 family protein [Nibribacter ruber]|uniref:Phosphatase PAP2 family protein n=1 Tax=Nibribacter ruber TaxID=2698458 RepID=A0A6P1NSG7_9BACT|nr:phosphatase PAP2 family protein [Nibribacter ruber]QHL85960.1 phosphatase PAP2 family protein [Nibribacter ruber]
MFKIPLLYLTEWVEAFFQVPYMRQLRSRYPRVFAFLHARFKTDHFYGLPLTILLVLMGVNLLLLSKLAENVVNSEATQAMDVQVSGFFFGMRSAELSLFLYAFTHLGNVYGVAAMTILAGIFFLTKRMFQHLVALLVSVMGSGLSMDLLKTYFHRDRPLDIAFYVPENSFSFPSGHSASAMALMGLLAYFCLVEVKHHRAKILLVSAGFAYTLLIGISRIYLGVHFLTDVVAGFLLGFLWVVLAIGVLEYLTIDRVKQAVTKEDVMVT